MNVQLFQTITAVHSIVYLTACNFSMHSVQFVITSRHYRSICISFKAAKENFEKEIFVYITWWRWTGNKLELECDKGSITCYNYEYTAPNMEEVEYKQLGMVWVGQLYINGVYRPRVGLGKLFLRFTYYSILLFSPLFFQTSPLFFHYSQTAPCSLNCNDLCF